MGSGATMAAMRHMDDVLEGIYQRLCIHAQDSRNAADHSMGVAELRTALGVSEALLKGALWLLSFPGDKRISFPAKDRVAMGPEWVARCEGPTSDELSHLPAPSRRGRPFSAPPATWPDSSGAASLQPPRLWA
jgi:hypothetical protein